MKLPNFLTWVILPLLIFITFNHCHAKQTQPISETQTVLDQFHRTAHQWWIHLTKFHETQLKFTTPFVISGVLCFIAASISSAGGIGGGGLFIPILTIVAGLDLKTASSFSAIMVTGSIIANVVYSMFITSRKFGGKTLIDYDIALLSQPCMLLGVSIGVICNIVFPEWLITILFVAFLGWSTFKTCKSGVLYWKLESEEVSRNGNLENGLVRNEICDGNEGGLESTKQSLLGERVKCKLGIPWLKLLVLVLIWLSFFVLYILLGSRYEKSTITQIEPCGVGYWILSSLQIPLAIIFTVSILYRRERHQALNSNQLQGKEAETKGGPSNKLVFPLMALVAGSLGGVFGIGGGMIISPLLLQVGVSPEVTAGTCSFMVLFSSSMSAIQYLLLGMENSEVAFIFSMVCFVASLLGLMVVKRAIDRHGRASLIVFSVGTVLALSTVLVTSFGALDVYRDYTNGNYMGFKQPCL